MDVLDKFLKLYSYKFDKGYPDINNPKDKEMLFELTHKLINEEKEEKLEDKLIKIIRSSNLTDEELQAYIKSITNKELKGDIISYLGKRGYTGDSFKVGDKALEYIFDKISDSEAAEFSEYIKSPKSFTNSPDKGNFKNVTGLSDKLIKDLINIEPGADAGGSAIGKGELFLALAFKDIDNRGGGGDLNYEGKNLEVKGTGGRLGQQAGRGSDFDYLSFLGEKYLEGEDLEEFLKDPQNKIINVSIKNLYDLATSKGANSNDIIKDVQKALDSIFFNKGLAKKYFNSPSDFKDLAEMKLKLTKLKKENNAQKTEGGGGERDVLP